MLTNNEVLEFQRLIIETSGKRLSYEEANNQGSRLIRLFELILKDKAIVRSGNGMVQND